MIWLIAFALVGLNMLGHGVVLFLSESPANIERRRIAKAKAKIVATGHGTVNAMRRIAEEYRKGML